MMLLFVFDIKTNKQCESGINLLDSFIQLHAVEMKMH